MLNLFSSILILFLLLPASCVSAETNPAVATLDAYLKIGAALSQDQHSEALKHTKDLNNAVSNINNEKAKAALTPIIEELSKTKDLDSARKSYEQLSSKLNTVKEDLGIQADEYYCPMVKKTWLQKDSKIVNPYVGKDMASCGEKKS